MLKIETSTKPIDPRNISPRTDTFLSLIGPYIASYDLPLKAHPSFVKGLNVLERESKMSTLLNYDCYIETDYTRFDMSISLPMLTDVQDLLLCLPFETDDVSRLIELLRMAHHTRGINELGIRYKVKGTRCSGDAHTSTGNTLLNHFNTWVALKDLPPNTWTSYHEGDDGVIACHKSVLDQVCYNLNILPCLGFQVKAQLYRSIDLVTFCGRWFYSVRGVLKSTCDLTRSLAKLHTTCHLGNPLALVLAKFLSYYHTDSSTPIIGPFITCFIRMYVTKISKSQFVRANRTLRRDWWFREHNKLCPFDYKNIKRDYVEIDGEARAMVALRTGLSPGMQMKYESYYKSFETLGYLPDKIDKLPGDWSFTLNSQYYGNVNDYVL